MEEEAKQDSGTQKNFNNNNINEKSNRLRFEKSEKKAL